MCKITRLRRGAIPYAMALATACLNASESAPSARTTDATDQNLIPHFLKQVAEPNLSRAVYYLAKDPLPFRKANYTVPGHSQNTLAETDAWIETQLRAWDYPVEREVCEVRAFGCDLKKPKHHTYAPPPPDAPVYQVCNLYAKKRGQRRPQEIILLVAHKDSQSWNDSPGAYDNAVGTAAVLHLDRAPDR